MINKNFIKRLISMTCVFILLLTIPTIAYDGISVDNSVNILVQNGYTTETAMALPISDRLELVKILSEDPTKVDINTIAMEVDNLEEIEALFSYSEKDLAKMGANINKVQATKKNLLELCNDKQKMARVLNASPLQVDMIRRAVNKGIDNQKSGVKYHKKSGINASGSITTSEMRYTQSVTDYSTSSAPKYKVKLSYNWKEVYALAVFDDVIAAAWGGGFNTKDISSRAKYYDWSNIGGSYGDYVSYKRMSKKETAQSGIEFEFPQSVSNGYFDNRAKTEKGYAKFTLYQNKYQGYDTKVLSNYCHQVISIGGASISISASGPSVGLNIGKGYDTTAQKSSTLTY